MKCLGLLRHAKSDWDDLLLRDFDRGLNNRGRRGAALMGRHIRQHGVNWELILASPAERVKRTLEASGLDVPVDWQEQAYLADSETLQSLLRAIHGNPARVLLAAHNPGLQQLVLDLVGRDDCGELCDAVATKYPTASYTVLRLPIDSWADLQPGCGKLVHFARPRDLDPELGPKD